MELQMQKGDYLPDGAGDFLKATGQDALLQRALFKLTARRGGFAPWPELGSRLYLLAREKPGARLAAAYQYTVEALEDETELTVEAVDLEELGEGLFRMQVQLSSQGSSYTMELEF